MNAKEQGRRRFLKSGAALAGLAVGGPPSASGQPMSADVSRIPPYGVRSRFETSHRGSGRLHSGQSPLQDSVGIITPNPLHYVVSHGAWSPDIDPQAHRLLVDGMVDRPLVFTMDELKRLPSVTRTHFLMCAGSSYVTRGPRRNARTVQETHGWTSCAEWTGVPLSIVLDEAGVQDGASWVVAEDVTKKWTVSIPLAKAMDDMVLVYGQNGEAIRPEQGYPLRMLAPGFEGTRSTKWLRRIKVVDEAYLTRWEITVYTNLMPDGKARWFQFEFEPNSVITFPSGEQQLPGPGFFEITGLAWSGGGAVSRVEVSVDGGRTWADAQIQEPVHRMAHTRFRFPWQWQGGEATLQSRCTDERGDIQPSLAELNQIWGVDNEYWTTSTNRVQHLNAIQPWKVDRDGSVHNAIWES
ncbi:MAG: sulfite dehydrogenase [Vicinamibacterales bacterium]|jgi:sulfane dehydrogenase subunit SoxC|nr:sulfite dehydrogenase [Acidobacteriota bacterium]MDP7294286.1 sulfite dehydrogenase [Vicinamibacterales bacterium]MDP7478428.1 sulfite dehydrogenase [Vicinamibacterales bacterium]MDP7672961.1 sulfite dehydrogenase [Vicinamibacterales bacterium]HJO38294.1 sulfite dehydrogenase [Vicinamibacterales bacterium]|tara:strand:- start:2092 stop:3321 length:1230 start_codon:yes stop_codon:yes gene_type:complete